jgi:hypothetical protein
MKLSRYIAFNVTDVGGLLLDGKTGKYWELNPSGALTLSLLLAGQPVEEICRRICAEYDVDAAESNRDVRELERHLSEAGLVE